VRDERELYGREEQELSELLAGGGRATAGDGYGLLLLIESGVEGRRAWQRAVELPSKK
jgi:hypothetical protein